jgi:hypothetical protein
MIVSVKTHELMLKALQEMRPFVAMFHGRLTEIDDALEAVTGTRPDAPDQRLPAFGQNSALRQ